MDSTADVRVLLSTIAKTSLHSFTVSVSRLFFSGTVLYREIAMAGQANNSLNLPDGDVDSSLGHHCRLYTFIVHTLIVGTLVVVGIIGNSLTFVIFWKGNFKSSTSFLFLSLSLIDSALLLAVFPYYTVMAFVEYTGWLQGYSSLKPYFKIYLFPSLLVTKTAAIWVIVLVAVNRYIIVCLPLKAAQWCSISKVKIQLAVVLIAAVLYNIPKYAEIRVAYYTMPTRNNDTMHVACTTRTILGQVRLFYIVYDNVFLLIFLLVLPILTLTVITIRLIKAMKAHRSMQLEMQSRSQQHYSNVTIALVIVVIVFIACQVPTFVFYVLWEVLPFEARYCGGFLFYFAPIVNVLVTLNSSINFLIYIMANTTFRDVLVENVCRRRTNTTVVTVHEMTSTVTVRASRAGRSTTVTQASVV